MAVSQFASGLLLDTYRDTVEEDIWLFNQVGGNGVRRLCDPYTPAQRDMIARTLEDAFQRMHLELGYAIAPGWWYEELALSVSDSATGLYARLGTGHVTEIGQRAVTEIESDATVTYSQTGNFAGVNDTASITVTTAVNVDEIAVFFRVADGATGAALPHWRIMPLKAVDNGDGTVTLTGHRALFVKPSGVWQNPYDGQYVEAAADTGTAGDFVTAVDVYRVYADATGAAVLTGCSGGEESVTLTIADPVEGVVQIADASACGQFPKTLRVYYRAGHPLNDGAVQTDLANAMVRLSNTIMPGRPDSMCSGATNVWQEDRVNYVVNDDDARFGVQFGQIEAWRTVKRWRLGCAAPMRTTRIRRQEGTL